ncbi:MAG: DUF3782 domain-containing protein [Nitrospirae bacterium]|nr:DUF3782 domain-containing protein [Nitrospirota bacterium]MBF0590595.1 DUF3782 domain-containing protein [Nitrospirota bacterium]
MTFEDVMKGFEAIGKDFERMTKDTEARTKDTEARTKDTEARIKEAEKSIKEFVEIKESFKEANKRLTKTEKLVEQTNRAINNLTGKWGNFVVGLVLPATKKMFREKGIVLKNTFKSAQSDEEGAKMEIDILAVNGEYVVAIEVKSTLGVDDVKKHIERLGKFRLAFKEYADRQIIGAVAGIVIEEGVDSFAYHNGLFVIGQRGDSVKILNDDKFVPKSY